MIERRKTKKNIVIAILIILVLALSGLSIYLLFFKDNIINNCTNVSNDKKDDDIVQNKLDIYGIKTDSGTYYICNHKSEENDCKDIIFSINTETPSASIIKGLTQFIIYYDNGVKLYNIKDESINKIDSNLNGDITWLPEGFINNSDDEAYYYDFKNNKKTFDKYEELYPVEDVHDSNYLDNLKYIYGKKGKSTSLIEFKTGNVIITIDNSNYEGVGFKKDGSYIITYLYGVEDTQNVLYNTKGEKVVELKSDQTFEINGSKLVIYEFSKKKVKEY